jgi:ABC-2 type transport system ATP-binding protein
LSANAAAIAARPAPSLRGEGITSGYGGVPVVRNVSIAVGPGEIVAIIGPNGAGKSTLLNLVVGLTPPTEGEVRVLGGATAGSVAALDGIGFVAQDMPLYRHLSVTDMLHLTGNLNLRFDAAYARRRLSELGIDHKQKAGKLSGGQQAQLALTLALARHPRLLVLDEPTAPLDPVARHDFMATVLTAMADDGVSVVLSSHMLAELERVTDYLVLISHGRVRVNDEVEDLLSCHRLVSAATLDRLNDVDGEVIESNMVGSQTHQLIRLTSPDAALPPDCEARPVGLEELALAYLREATALPALSPVGATR